MTHQKTADFKLTEHPEGFQLDKKLNKIFVNVPNAGQIDVIDTKSARVIAKWKTEYSANFPMTIDESHHIIFVGYRRPAKLTAIDESNGRTIAVTDLTGDCDDLFYDDKTEKIYASGGSGTVDIYNYDGSKFTQIASIKTRTGARTSLFVPALNKLVLAQRANGKEAAQLSVFTAR